MLREAEPAASTVFAWEAALRDEYHVTVPHGTSKKRYEVGRICFPPVLH